MLPLQASSPVAHRDAAGQLELEHRPPVGQELELRRRPRAAAAARGSADDLRTASGIEALDRSSAAFRFPGLALSASCQMRSRLVALAEPPQHLAEVRADLRVRPRRRRRARSVARRALQVALAVQHPAQAVDDEVVLGRRARAPSRSASSPPAAACCARRTNSRARCRHARGRAAPGSACADSTPAGRSARASRRSARDRRAARAGPGSLRSASSSRSKASRFRFASRSSCASATSSCTCCSGLSTADAGAGRRAPRPACPAWRSRSRCACAPARACSPSLIALVPLRSRRGQCFCSSAIWPSR